MIGQQVRSNSHAGDVSLTVQIGFAWGGARLSGMRVLKGKGIKRSSQFLQLGLQFV